MAQDDVGRLFYNYNWSQLHADLVPPNALLANKNHTPTTGIDHGLTLDRRIFPIRSNTAVNRGYIPGTLDDKKRLLEFASACAPLIYRGTSMPEVYRGDAFVCEPTSNLIKQNTIIEEGFMMRAEATYDNKEFLASTDERFRPISLASGPDGAMYVVDIYKGVIQHAPYMTTYLREETLKRGLDKPIHMGRVWRITSKTQKERKKANFSGSSTNELIKQLEGENGWTRDTAQRLLVEKEDLSIVPELKQLIKNGNAFGQFHALWTLEGLGYKNPEIYLSALHSIDPKVAQTALRIAVAVSNEHPEVIHGIENFIQNNYNDAASNLKMQMVLASRKISPKIAFDISMQFLKEYGQLPLARDVVMSSLEGREIDMLSAFLPKNEEIAYNQNREIFLELLVTAIANSESSTHIYQLKRTSENFGDTKNIWIKNAIVNGIENTSSVESYNSSTIPKNVDQKLYATGRQKYINICASCHGTNGIGMKRFAPPLKKSEWVTGDDQKLAMLLLHGMQGPVEVNGKKYDIPDILPEMPSFLTLQNKDITAIAT